MSDLVNKRVQVNTNLKGTIASVGARSVKIESDNYVTFNQDIEDTVFLFDVPTLKLRLEDMDTFRDIIDGVLAEDDSGMSPELKEQLTALHDSLRDFWQVR